MKKLTIVLIVAAFLILLGVAAIFLLPRKPVVEAVVDIKPDSVNLHDPPKWFNASIRLPEPYNVSDINVTSLRLEQIPAVEAVIEDSVLTARFDGATVTNLLWTKTYHMGLTSPAMVELKVTGLVDETEFEGRDEIEVVWSG